MRWSWNHATDGLWRTLDPTLWDLTQNPWVVLQTVSRNQIEHVLADPAFRKNMDDRYQMFVLPQSSSPVFARYQPQGSLLGAQGFGNVHVCSSCCGKHGRDNCSDQ